MKYPAFSNNRILIITVVSLCFLLGTYLLVKKYKSKAETFQPNDHKTLLFFKAQWCGHCTRFKPVWDSVVSECNSNDRYKNIDFIEMDVDEEETKPYMEKHQVRGFPHVVMTKPDGAEKVFAGNRTSDELLSFIEEN
jgi:thiol-disulfide isomerase/thioredoxin